MHFFKKHLILRLAHLIVNGFRIRKNQKHIHSKDKKTGWKEKTDARKFMEVKFLTQLPAKFFPNPNPLIILGKTIYQPKQP